MKNQLIDLYQSKWEKLSSELQAIYANPEYKLKPTNPLLINLDEENYSKADLKVMVIGQETNSWFEDFNPDINQVLNVYDKFFNNGDPMNTYGGHFWNGIKRFKNLLEEKFPNKTKAFVWNNIIKIGNSERNTNKPADYTYEVERKYFSVIQKEIEILNPDLILFFTGPDYDYIMDNALENLKRTKVGNQFEIRQLAKIDLGNTIQAFRTYHPKALSFYGTEKYFKEILAEIE